jgi:hypothetical protein
MRSAAIVVLAAVAFTGCTVQSSTEAARVPYPVPITDPIYAVYRDGDIRVEFTIENTGEGRLTWIAVMTEFFLARGTPMQRLPGWSVEQSVNRHLFSPPLRKGERATVGIAVPARGLARALQDRRLQLADVLMDLCISHNSSQGAHADGTIIPLPICVGSIRVVTPEEHRRLVP